MTEKRWPNYDELPRFDPIGMNHAWGVFGAEDEVGTVNLLSPAVVVAAATEIVRGETFNLSLPLNSPRPRRGDSRSPYRHHVFSIDRNTQDDVIDNLYMQASTQWDALRHVRAREFGFYNGVAADVAGPNGTGLGIDRWAEHGGIVGRGVLLDIVRHLERSQQHALTPDEGFAISPELIEEALQAQNCTLREGDILMLRTGYMRAVLAPEGDRPRSWPGLAPGEEMARYLWNKHVAAVVADNPAVETAPGDPKEFLHRRLIPMLGIALGEFFNLEAIADDSEQDGKYTCCFIGIPLNLPGGVGSPGNAIAIK